MSSNIATSLHPPTPESPLLLGFSLPFSNYWGKAPPCSVHLPCSRLINFIFHYAQCYCLINAPPPRSKTHPSQISHFSNTFYSVDRFFAILLVIFSLLHYSVSPNITVKTYVVTALHYQFLTFKVFDCIRFSLCGPSVSS